MNLYVELQQPKPLIERDLRFIGITQNYEQKMLLIAALAMDTFY